MVMLATLKYCSFQCPTCELLRDVPRKDIAFAVDSKFGYAEDIVAVFICPWCKKEQVAVLVET